MDELKLKNFTNWNRFPISTQVCPECKQHALYDSWPPDYGGGADYSGGAGAVSKSWGSSKFVCIPCKIAFRISFKKTTKHIDDGTFIGKSETETEISVSKTVPLVEKDGFLLTPHDVFMEEYKEKNGEYPQVAFG